MFISRNSAKPFTIPGGVTGILYPSSPRGDQTIAAVTQDGIYPAQGYSVNDVATETIYCIEGSMTIEANGECFPLTPGDCFMIFPGTKYRVTGTGKSIDFITPAWEKNTNRIVPE
ncbi:cupin domain-containing protein [Candidatus Uhrbacteria bacterium]|nr:cupin domain-containing protein [Candidatus Uhrbacteria bacterium]